MGERKAKRARFLESHPLCAFCGGASLATTEEHCPPRSAFLFKQWPEGFVFPACEKCNVGTANYDVVVAVLARAAPGHSNADGATSGMILNADRQFPGFLQPAHISANEARKINRYFGIKPGDGLTHKQTVGAFRITDAVSRAVDVFATKLAKAVFYREASRIFPTEGCLALHWFTSADAVENGLPPAIQALVNLPFVNISIVRNAQLLNDQFAYRWTQAFESNGSDILFILQAMLGNSFGIVVFGSTMPGRLEHLIAEKNAEAGTEPFRIIWPPMKSGI